MKSQKIHFPSRLIFPQIIQNNENEKNEGPSSGSKISVKPIIKPKPLNINLSNEINDKLMNKNEELNGQKLDSSRRINNPKEIIFDNSISK